MHDPFGAVFVSRFSGALYLRQGALAKGIRELERCVSLHQDAHIEIFSAQSTALLALAYALSERFAEALPLLGQAREKIPTVVGGSSASVMITLSEGYLLTGRREEALTLAEQAHRLSFEHKERGNQVYALRLLAEIAMHRNPPDIDHAETHYQQALALADELGMRPLQAHCHRGLGTLYSQTGQPNQARAELSTAIDMYRDMEMTFWLPEAKVALAQVEKR